MSSPPLKPRANIFHPEPKLDIIEIQNEEIIALKLLNFEAQIEIIRKEDEIKKLKCTIEKLLK